MVRDFLISVLFIIGVVAVIVAIGNRINQGYYYEEESENNSD